MSQKRNSPVIELTCSVGIDDRTGDAAIAGLK